MNLNLFTDDVDPDYDDGPRFVKVAPGTFEEQCAALEERLANIDKWLANMAENGGTLHAGLHSSARFDALCARRDRVAEHVEYLTAVIIAQTPDPEPPNAELGWRWQVMDAIDADEEHRFGKAGVA